MNKFLLLCIVFTVELFAFDFKAIETFQANFIQTITNQSGKEIKYDGEVFIKKPLKVLWKYQAPISKDVYLINNRVTIIEPDLEQAIISKLKEEVNILEILQNGKEIEKGKYEAELYSKKYLFTIQNDTLASISYQDEVENDVMIRFFDIKQNKAISDTIYTFQIPDEYDIIRK